jgi:hypothetical protein
MHPKGWTPNTGVQFESRSREREPLFGVHPLGCMSRYTLAIEIGRAAGL